VILGLARASSTWQQIAGGVNGMLNLQYSRGHEFAADDGGLKNLLAAGYRPQGMIDLFKTLQKAGGDGGTPEFLRTHPLTSERIKRAENKIEALSDNNRDGSDQR
jgi:predicted Zn-dependent protease